MQRTINVLSIILFLFTLSPNPLIAQDDGVNDEKSVSPKVVIGELGMGYLFAGGCLIAGTGIGQVIYPKKEEHAGGGLVGALMGFCVGGSLGVYIIGERFDGDSTNDPLVFFSTLGGGLSVPLFGFMIGQRKILTWGVLFSPMVSCLTYNLVKKRETESEHTFTPLFMMSISY